MKLLEGRRREEDDDVDDDGDDEEDEDDAEEESDDASSLTSDDETLTPAETIEYSRCKMSPALSPSSISFIDLSAGDVTRLSRLSRDINVSDTTTPGQYKSSQLDDSP